MPTMKTTALLVAALIATPLVAPAAALADGPAKPAPALTLKVSPLVSEMAEGETRTFTVNIANKPTGGPVTENVRVDIGYGVRGTTINSARGSGWNCSVQWSHDHNWGECSRSRKDSLLPPGRSYPPIKYDLVIAGDWDGIPDTTEIAATVGHPIPDYYPDTSEYARFSHPVKILKTAPTS